ncbi:MAG: DNA gyrase subunit A [Oscillospiraceae bacterium]|jgi:DNA gyrase subunit A
MIEEGSTNSLYTEGKIVDVDIEPMMKNSFLDYSMSVIVSRALPDVRDGLKPVHRRILYTMGEKGLTHDKPYHKSADTVGAVLASYHPHGDASVYDAMVRLAQDFSMRYPLVDPQGNFGSVDGDPAAAYRYTEARMSALAEYMLKDIDKETVDFIPNYDGRMLEPTVLPSRVPQLLMNGSTGIAVGMATNIPPHNLNELIDGIDYLIDNPDCDPLDLCKYIKGPDFPTGGIIMGRSGIRSAYATGRGRIILRGRAEIEENGSSYRIIVTEIPYMVNKARLIESIANLVKDKRIEGIRDLRDESDREGMRIVVELKRDANPQIVLNQLYQYTQLQDTVGVIMLAIKDGEPKIMNLKEMLSAYLEFQEEVVRRKTEYELKKASDRAHILDGLKKAVDIVDDIIATIRACKGGVAEAKQAIMEKFGFDDPQASAIVAFRLGQLAGLEILKIENELAELKEKIADYKDILSNKSHLTNIIKQDLEEARQKFGDERKTEIAPVEGELDIEDLIPNETCMITATHSGYFKRQSAAEYRSQKRGGRGISGLSRKDEDFVEDLFVCSSHDYLMFVTSFGRVYRIKAYEIAEGSRGARGINIVNIIPLIPGEVVHSTIRVGEEDSGKYLVMVTRKGVIKRTPLDKFSNIRKTGIIGITLDEGDEVAWTRLTSGNDDLIIATSGGMAIRFNENDVRPMGRNARGVKAITLKPGQVVVGMSVAGDSGKLLTVTENGKGRLTDISEYHVQKRGGLGNKNYDCEAKGTQIAGVKVVNEDTDDVIMISETGIIIRMHASDIATQSRYGGGVNVMRLGEGDKVVTVAKTERDDLEDDSDEGDVPVNPESGEDIEDSLEKELSEKGIKDED